MMDKYILSALFALMSVVFSITAANVRMEPSVHVFSSKMWLKETQSALKEEDPIEAIFVLKTCPYKLKQFENTLLDLSTPSSANYGKWLKPEEIKTMIAPKESSLKIVKEYLASFGVSEDNMKVSKFGDLITVTMDVKTANLALQTEFALFRSVVRRDVVIPRITKPYYLPAEVAEVVSLVDDIMRFPAVRSSLRATTRSGAEAALSIVDDEYDSCGTKCNRFTTPAVLQSAYGYYSPLKSAAPGNSMSVAEFQFQYYDTTDLHDFGSACIVTAKVDKTIGGNKPAFCTVLGGCVEALLDIEYIEAVAYPIPLTVIYSPSYSLVNWVTQVISLPSPPLVNSVSYGNDEVQQTSAQYMESVNIRFMIAGALGISILFASGDQGVWGRSGVGKKFNPDFPATSPYVTSVGGTDFAVRSTVGPETAWSCSGGGFSDVFPLPSWQANVVKAYFTKASEANVLPRSTLYNSTGRGYPDIAVLGGKVNPYCVVYSGGSFGGVYGTSASCPVAAGIFAQLNNVRLAAGKSSLGWLNPLIYSNPQCFNDIGDGSQNNCNIGTTGFAALSGWDPATGLGSPNFACLAKVVV